MTFISYAQNFEDVMLWRALKQVENGFYIDVGANDPTIDSVTRAFYERGWHGINIEPMAQYHERLGAERPRDINLRIAVGDRETQLTFFDIADTGLSTMDEAIAASHRAAGRAVAEHPVKVLTLDAVCVAHVQGPIHFLKIDVEGFEPEVLRGANLARWRPWILVIEATRPLTSESSHTGWERTVLEAGYAFAYFDGLNQYYVAEEHRELLDAFKAPPNYFDGFTLRSGHHYSYPLAELERQAWVANVKVGKLEARLKQLESRALVAEAKAQLAEVRTHHTVVEKNAEVHSAQQQLAAVYASSSWRVTRPLRGLMLLARQPDVGLVRVKAKCAALARVPLRLVHRSLRKVVAHPKIRIFLLEQLARHPSLEAKIRGLARKLRDHAEPAPPPAQLQENVKHLPEPARRVYADLKRTLASKDTAKTV